MEKNDKKKKRLIHLPPEVTEIMNKLAKKVGKLRKVLIESLVEANKKGEELTLNAL